MIKKYYYQEFVVDTDWFKRLGKVIVRKKVPKNKYKLIESDVKKDAQWPYVGRVTFEK